jgi:hypothetical protein
LDRKIRLTHVFMDNRTTILNELREISPVVAGIGPGIPYSVPAGYFNELPANILLKINMGEVESPTLSPISKSPVYEVPAGYFEGLAATVLNRIKASSATSPQEELAFISPLLNRLDKKSPLTMPAGYFNELSDNVVSGVQAIEFVNEELENLSPLMTSLKEKQVYEAPARYFDRLPAEILRRVQTPAKVVSFSFRKRIVRYAAAAVVTGALAVGGYFYFAPHKIIDTVDSQIAQVPDQELENFLTDNTVALADAGTIVTNDTISENDSKDLFANVSDDELQKYLEEHGGVSNPVTN